MAQARSHDTFPVVGSGCRVVVLVVDDQPAEPDGGRDSDIAVCRVDSEQMEQLIGQLRPGRLDLVRARALVRSIHADPPSDQDITRLSIREQEVLGYISQGYTHSQTATRMCVGKATVNTYVERIRRKLGAGNKADLTRIAMSLELGHRDTA